MADPTAPISSPSAATALGSATYEIIRQRLQGHGATLRERMARLDERRREVFGAIEYKLLQSDRITTTHNCVPRDMVQLGRGRFLFGFNVTLGLKKEVELGDVFAVFKRDPDAGSFTERDLDVLHDPAFLTDFRRLYNVYAKASFAKFSLIGPNLFFVFRIGAAVTDIAVFKWVFNGGQLRYVDGRAETEYRNGAFPPQLVFRWQIPPREAFRYGSHPHISIEDRVFVECVGGDLTLKVEDNTASGEGIYSEPVEDQNQKVDDAEVAYATPLPNIILLKVRPYKETAYRYLIFNDKEQSAVRVDSVGQSCALLPEDHGLIFPDGYYLATGDLKRFEGRERDLVLERVVHAPNGEDSLYVFYNRMTGEYVLMPYRLIAQKVEERISCHGFSLFADGNVVLFRTGDEAQKHHTIQLRQTPFHEPGFEPEGRREAFLYQVGNKDVVRCLAECNEVLTLIGRDNPYAELYSDVVKRTNIILDAHPWLKSEDGFQIDEAVRELGSAADKAVEEFDKVRRLQREAAQRVKDAQAKCDERFNLLRRASFRVLDDFVQNLAALRQLRGELITLKEVRYVELPLIEELEKTVIERSTELARSCVEFLLQPTALEPYRQRAAEFQAGTETIAKGAEGRKLAEAVAAAGGELELLIEIVNGLRIDDATEATRIIDGITAIYATLNQVKAALKNRLQSLAAAEGAAQFGAQMKLLGQAASSYLDLCETPAKCDEYLNRISVQIEELEGAFADFEDFTVQLAEKRTALYEAFEQRKVALVEQRNRKTAALLTAAERVLKSIQNRLATLKSIEEIHSLIASDLMVTKVREIIAQLLDLGDSVKADDLQGRLKSVQQDAVRQLRDKQELFVGGDSVIQLGKHRFNFNTQPLELTVVNRDDAPHLHLTSTKYFSAITDEAFLATRKVWDQEVVSETAQVYRSEYLAARLLAAVEARSEVAKVAAQGDAEWLALAQEFAASRYDEGYTKGVHDLDGAKIFGALVTIHEALELARYEPTARACAWVFWHRYCAAEVRTMWTAKLKGFGERNRLFPGDKVQPGYIAALRAMIGEFVATTKWYPAAVVDAAGEYLFHELSIGEDRGVVVAESFVVSREADEAATAFQQHLLLKGGEASLVRARTALVAHPGAELDLVRDYVGGFLRGRPEAMQVAEEVAALIYCGGDFSRRVVPARTAQTLEGMKGAHAVIRDGRYEFDYAVFRQKLARYDAEVVPRFAEFQRLKRDIIEHERARLRLEEFKPRVLTSFVRNQLIDQVYLPLVGDNLAKQIGAAGAAKRTDLMGLLLLISPPGYGKTTLLEYVASRLGIIFVKINGPALGHEVTSLDPASAPNSAAREELNRLNLAFEMGDNVMLCIDDIQHCSPEFLQKFISLCDGQRKIEGVWRGQPRTHDLRGRKVVVVMAGNPYTESGQKFRIPDMLANRADTYNLGDIIGGSAEWFKASYLENAITSNAVLAPLAQRSQKDIRAFIRLAAGGERDAEGFEGSYSAQEVEEIVAVMKKLVAIRDVVLSVNLEYIHSAAQAEEYRTEPPFRLQGSYRNMNRLAEKIVPLMNDAEVRALIIDHYRGESQTLTTGAEANFLKFKELINALSAGEQTRWDEIKRTFKRNLLAPGADKNDPMARVVGQLAGFQVGLQGIQAALERSAGSGGAESPPANAQFSEGLKTLGDELSRALAASHSSAMTQKVDSLMHEVEMVHSTLATLKHLAAQRLDHLRAAQAKLEARVNEGVVAVELTQEMLTNERTFLEKFDTGFVRRAPGSPSSKPIPPSP
jgi:hypothetical protein